MSPRDCFLESLERCNASPDFISAFYRRFIDSSEDIRHMFRNTNFEKQEAMLRESLALIADATQGDTWGIIHLRERARSHSHDHLNVNPRLYDFWLEACIETAAEFDPQWNDEIKKVWQDILGYGVQEMTRYY